MDESKGDDLVVNVCATCYTAMQKEINYGRNFFFKFLKCVDDLIFKREYVKPVSGLIVIPEIKKVIAFEMSLIPRNYEQLILFVSGKLTAHKIGEFNIEMLVGKDFYKFMDNVSYALIQKCIHKDASKKMSLNGLKIHVIPLTTNDLVCFFFC